MRDVAAVAVGRTRERAMAGNAHVFRLVGFSSHRYTSKFGNSVNPVPPHGRAQQHSVLYGTTRSKARPDTTLALGALSRQTPPVSNTPVPPSPPSVSFPPCVLSWRTWRRLKIRPLAKPECSTTWMNTRCRSQGGC